MKRLTEVDLDVLLAEAGTSSKKNKKNAVPYTGRSREVIEKEVQALLGQEPDDESDVEDEAQPSTSRDGEERPDSSELSLEDSTNNAVPATVSIGTTETYTIIDDGSGPTVWTENGEAVVVTIAEAAGDGVTDVQQQPDLHDIIQGEILMLE